MLKLEKMSCTKNAGSCRKNGAGGVLDGGQAKLYRKVE